MSLSVKINNILTMKATYEFNLKWIAPLSLHASPK